MALAHAGAIQDTSTVALYPRTGEVQAAEDPPDGLPRAVVVPVRENPVSAAAVCMATYDQFPGIHRTIKFCVKIITGAYLPGALRVPLWAKPLTPGCSGR